MDGELKQYLDEHFMLIANLLTSEIGTRIGEVNLRLDRIEQRLDRQAGLIQTGARQTVRFTQWSERCDVALQEMQKQINELNKRVRKMESGE